MKDSLLNEFGCSYTVREDPVAVILYGNLWIKHACRVVWTTIFFVVQLIQNVCKLVNMCISLLSKDNCLDFCLLSPHYTYCMYISEEVIATVNQHDTLCPIGNK